MLMLLFGMVSSALAANPEPSALDKLIGQPADIAASAYSYRADRKAGENPPEAWILLLQHGNLPFNQPVDVNAPAVRKALCGLLWEEVRPVRRVELSWPGDAKNRPSVDELAFDCFDGTDKNPHTWWNPGTIKAAEKPEVSADGHTCVYSIPVDSWGVVVSVRGEKDASAYAVPTIRAFGQDAWKKMDVEIEWGFDGATAALGYDGRIEAYDGIIGNVRPLPDDAGTAMTGPYAWRSVRHGGTRRGLHLSLLYIGTSRWRHVHPDRAQQEDVARSIVTLWTKSGSFSFRVSDLEQGPILAPEHGFFVRATAKPPSSLASEAPFTMESAATTARDFLKELQGKGLQTIRQRVRKHTEQTWQDAVAAMYPDKELPPQPKPPFEPAMQVEVPDERLTAQWKLGAWHILRRSVKDQNGKWSFNDYPFGILAAETGEILRALDFQGMHKEAADGLDQWLSLPMQAKATLGSQGLPDRPLGHFSDGRGVFTHAVGPPGVGGNMDGIHPLGPGIIMHAMNEHFRLTGDREWLKANAPRMKANAEWILCQRHLFADNFPGGQRLWSKGLQPAMCGTTDANVMYTQFYLMDAYYWLAVREMAELLAFVDPASGARMSVEADAYRNDILTALNRSITLTPIMAVRDGTYRSFIPLSSYARGLCAGAWGWQRCQGHTGALYWDAGLVTTPLINPAGLLSVHDRRVQGFLDVLEDRLLLENPKVYQRTSGYDPGKDWFSHAGWQYQCGFERTPLIHLEADDIPNFIRSMLNQYAVDIQLEEYTFREHTVGGPPDKTFEEASFLERFRHMLVMEEGNTLWLARGTPRAWLEPGKKISVKNAPSRFGTVAYEIVSDVDNGRIKATVEMPLRNPPKSLFLRFRHPTAAPIKSVTVNGKAWKNFAKDKEIIHLERLTGKVTVVADYGTAAK